MRGTSSLSDEFTSDFGFEPDAISISDRGLICLLARKLSPLHLRLLQQYRHIAAVPTAPGNVGYRG
jgi:hypothetical protein